MFSPKIAQSEIQGRSNDIEDLKKGHAQFVRKMEVKVQLLENENAARKGENQSLAEFHKKLADNVKTINEIIIDLKNYVGISNKSFERLESAVRAINEQKLDLAARIMEAQKRLDDSEKP